MLLTLLFSLLVLADAGLHYINDHKGHPFRQDYSIQEAANPQPPFQVIENRQIGKRRLDVWKPIPATPSSSSTKPTLSTTQTPWKPPSLRLQPVDAVPKRTYFQLAPLSTPQPEVLTKQGLEVQQAPLLKPQHIPLAVPTQGLGNVQPPRPRVNLPQTRVDKRPRYPQIPKRPPGPAVPKRSDHSTPKRPELQLPKRADLLAPKRQEPIAPKRQASPVPRRPDPQATKRPVPKVPQIPDPLVPKKPDRLVAKRPEQSALSRPDQPVPRRPTSRLPQPPQNSLSQPKLEAHVGRKPVLRGFPPRKGLQTPAQDRRDASQGAHFTYKAASSALPIGKPLLLNQANGRPTNKFDSDTRDFEELLFHLGKYSEDDDYVPTKSKPAKIKPTKLKPTKAKTDVAKPSKAKPTKPSKRPKRKITLPPKPKRKVNLTPQRPKTPSPPLSQKPPTTTQSPNQTTEKENIDQEEKNVAAPLFPQFYKQDVMNALDAVDQSVQPLFHAASVITSSLSLDATRRQTVEDVLEKAGNEPLDNVADTIQFTMDQVLAKPEPFIVISAILLSVITGTAIGSSLTTVGSATRSDRDTKVKDGLCPDGYEIVWIGEDGLEDILGRIGHYRMRRDLSEGQETAGRPARRGYPFRQAEEEEDEEEENSYGAGHYCRKRKATTYTKDSAPTGGSAPGVGIKVNSHGNDNHSGSSGQVSIKVGGVSINVGGDGGPAARAEVEELPETEVREESRVHETHHHEEDMDELSGVLDGAKYVIMDSLRQIRSLLAG